MDNVCNMDTSIRVHVYTPLYVHTFICPHHGTQDLDEPVIEYIAEIVANEREIDAKGIYETFGELLIRYDAAEDEADAQELSGLLATALQKQGIIEDYTSADAGATTVWVQANNSVRAPTV